MFILFNLMYKGNEILSIFITGVWCRCLIHLIAWDINGSNNDMYIVGLILI